MTSTSTSFRSSRRHAARIAVGTALFGMAAAAHAKDYNEGAVTTGTVTYTAGVGQNGTCVNTLCTSYSTPNDLSNDGAHPTNIGTLTSGNNYITGQVSTWGPTLPADAVDASGQPIGVHGELTNQDMDYATFTVPTGYVLSNLLVGIGTSIMTGLPAGPGATRNDQLFLGLASGSSITGIPYGSNANNATGLLGYTLVSQPLVGSDILSAIGNPMPALGATTFTGSLGAGTYTLWLYDGDNRASYAFDLVTTATPEPATWAMMIVGFGLVGYVMRRRQGAGRVAAFA